MRLFLSDAGNTDITSANLDTGSSFSNSTTYYVYSSASSSTAASSTYYISLSSTAPTGPTYYAQLGYFITNGSGAISTLINNNSKDVNIWQTKNTGTIYQALTDGYVICSVNSGLAGNQAIILYDDTKTPPTQVIQQQLVQVSNSDNRFSVSSLIAKGDYYECTIGSGSANMLFRAIGQ